MPRLIVMTLTLAVLLAAPLAMPAYAADEIADTLKRGLELYDKGELAKAIGELEFALAQMRQKKADSLTQVFPDAPAGWQAQDAKSKSAAAGFMGGGITAERAYTQDGGQGRVTIEIMSDSPMLQSLAMMLNNPMMLQGGDQGRLVRYKGNKALLKTVRNNRAELSCVLGGKILLQVKAGRVDNPEKVVMDFADKIDVDKLMDMAG